MALLDKPLSNNGISHHFIQILVVRMHIMILLPAASATQYYQPIGAVQHTAMTLHPTVPAPVVAWPAATVSTTVPVGPKYRLMAVTAAKS